MRPELKGPDVVAHCPDCGGRSTFESQRNGKEHGYVLSEGSWQDPTTGATYGNRIYRLLRCASCGRGGTVGTIGMRSDQ